MLLTNWHKPGEPDELSLEDALRPFLLRLRVDQIQAMIEQRLLSDNEQQAYREDSAGKRVPLDVWFAKRRGMSHPLAIVYLASRVDLMSQSDHDYFMRQLGEELPVDLEIRSAVSRGGLVVVENPRTAYWRCITIPIDWNRYPKAWPVFVKLAQKAGTRALLTESDVYDFRDGCADSALPTVISRLKQLLPEDLGERIRAVREKKANVCAGNWGGRCRRFFRKTTRLLMPYPPENLSSPSIRRFVRKPIAPACPSMF
jgi:hypothetical protein